MSRAYRTPPRVLVLEAEARAAAEELAEAAGVTPSAFIEMMLLDLRDRTEPEPEPEPASQGNVIPITRGQRRRRRYRRPPEFDL
jgi:hypothetical protein